MANVSTNIAKAVSIPRANFVLEFMVLLSFSRSPILHVGQQFVRPASSTQNIENATHLLPTDHKWASVVNPVGKGGWVDPRPERGNGHRSLPGILGREFNLAWISSTRRRRKEVPSCGFISEIRSRWSRTKNVPAGVGTPSRRR